LREAVNAINASPVAHTRQGIAAQAQRHFLRLLLFLVHARIVAAMWRRCPTGTPLRRADLADLRGASL
jgi:hypothetical protein